MQFRRRSLGLAAASAALFAPQILRAQPAGPMPATEITVQYAQPFIFKESYDALQAEFARREPNIRITWVTTPNYEEGMQLILRQAATRLEVDLSYQGFNRLRIFAEREIAQDVMPLIRREGDPAALGYSPTILGTAHFGGFQSGLGYAASNPIMFYNADLVRRAGGNPDAMPTSWDGVFDLARRIEALGDGTEGLYFPFAVGDWMFQALVFGHGGRMLSEDEREVAFGGPEGLAAVRLLDRMVREGGMPNLTIEAAQQAFAAGRLGMLFWTTAVLRGTIQQVGRNFELRTTVMPVIDRERGRLPTGGAAGMLIARDPQKREAAWRFLRFSTSAEGTTIMVKNTGYVPMNQLAIDDPRFLGAFYRDNPLFLAATRQVPIMTAWYAFPGANSVRMTQAIANHLTRIAEQRATPEVVLAEMSAEVARLLPRPRG